ncbi:MAG: preprotein translocase subunit YajC [Bifidobacteriaceae bacterium]|nr:preprotein translocase subunit YajC [Bifidobacteriaceae bacterium]
MTIFDVAVLAEGEEPATQPGGGGGNYVLLIFIGGMILLMWFMSRRNKKQQQQQGDFRRALDVGQRVMTVGGMIGVVTQVNGDVLTLMSPSGDESAYLRRAIKSVVSDEEWGNLTEPYPLDEDELPDSAEESELDGSAEEPELDGSPADADTDPAGGQDQSQPEDQDK